MDFQGLLTRFAEAVESGDGKRLAALFTEDGVYHDTFYGEFKGHDAIARMLENYFYRDAEAFRWEMTDPVCDGQVGYARWVFSYTAKVAPVQGKRVCFEGMSCFHLSGDRIAHYGEAFNSGPALVQLGVPAEKMEKVFRRWWDEIAAKPAVARHLQP